MVCDETRMACPTQHDLTLTTPLDQRHASCSTMSVLSTPIRVHFAELPRLQSMSNARNVPQPTPQRRRSRANLALAFGTTSSRGGHMRCACLRAPSLSPRRAHRANPAPATCVPPSRSTPAHACALRPTNWSRLEAVPTSLLNPRAFDCCAVLCCSLCVCAFVLCACESVLDR